MVRVEFEKDWQTTPEAFWRRGFDPVSTLLLDLYHYVEQNGAFWLVPEHAPGPSSQVLPGCRVQHPLGSKKVLVRIWNVSWTKMSHIWKVSWTKMSYIFICETFHVWDFVRNFHIWISYMRHLSSWDISYMKYLMYAKSRELKCPIFSYMRHHETFHIWNVSYTKSLVN